MATASFNTEINAPTTDGEQNTYNLNTILTLSGFDLESISFRLSEKYYGISISKSDLIIDYGAYGNFSIIVEDGLKASATASTTIKMTYGGSIERYFQSPNVKINYETLRASWEGIVTLPKSPKSPKL